MSTPLLSAQTVAVSYGKIEAVLDVSLVIPKGRIITVIGANGAGKSSLLGSLMGILPLAGGSATFEGEPLDRVPVEQRVARGLCLVPEKRELFVTMSVAENLELGAYHRPRSEAKSSLEMVYDLFPRLLERRKQAAGTLSGGERQMLAMGRALMAKPKLLMLDEPSLGLAPRIVKEIFGLIGRLRDSGVSILLVEQNARGALRTADYAYVMETGQVTLQGPAADLAQDPRVIESYLGISGGDSSCSLPSSSVGATNP
ncbi:MAG: ABC transporter ATP-binding protein [Rhodospirillum sp.]|nr:ABC transporter ATP-binding protein [Rhodospirillum sp.]MCF8489779.1 ABC transporter ATP-binding protein [Rhodospirillum sp.]